MNNIYFTEEFKEDIMNEENSIEMSKYRLSPYLKDSETGMYLHPDTKEIIKSPSQIDYAFMLKSNFSPQDKDAYYFEGIYDKKTNNLKLYLPALFNGKDDNDAGIRLNNEVKAYRILYVFYSNSLNSNIVGSTTGNDRLAFIMYDRASRPGADQLRLNPLYLGRHGNLINLNIPFKCEVLTRKDTDTIHLEGTGVDTNYANIFSIDSGSEISKSTYIDKRSYMRYYYNSISSNDPYYGGVTINKFGLKSY